MAKQTLNAYRTSLRSVSLLPEQDVAEKLHFDSQISTYFSIRALNREKLLEPHDIYPGYNPAVIEVPLIDLESINTSAETEMNAWSAQNFDRGLFLMLLFA